MIKMSENTYENYFADENGIVPDSIKKIRPEILQALVAGFEEDDRKLKANEQERITELIGGRDTPDFIKKMTNEELERERAFLEREIEERWAAKRAREDAEQTRKAG